MTAANLQPSKTALLLPGGGARAAYQVGVIKALAEMTGEELPRPFPILCGTSAGAINAVALATRADDFVAASRWLEELWQALEAHQVYRSDWFGLWRNGLRLLASLFTAGSPRGRPVALLDNRPLRELLRKQIDFARISEHLRSGVLEAVCVTAMNYTEHRSVSFFQGGPKNAGWQRWRRQGVPTPLQLRHVMASTAIPTIFPPQRIGRNYYGDGALRQMTPVSPALHLGADKILIISGAGHHRYYSRPSRRILSPAFGQIIGHLLNSAFVDSLETDIELLERINELLELIPEEQREKADLNLRPVESLVISPSEDLDQLAEEYAGELPHSMRTLMSVTGSSDRGGVNIASFLLFTPAYCERLIALGYHDGMEQREELQRFLGLAASESGLLERAL